MFEHRLIAPIRITPTLFDSPFSSFRHIEENYSDNNAIRRLFSLARSHNARILLTEQIEPAGIILDENDEIRQYYNDYQMTDLKRISFWRSETKEPRVDLLNETDLVGYAILKKDKTALADRDHWHVFEAVFTKYDHVHNCVPSPQRYEVTLSDKRVGLKGLLFAQQNGLNKCCAQVALMSVLSRISDEEISYRQINDFAKTKSSGFNPSLGLRIEQVRAVLRGFGIGFRDFDYVDCRKGDRQRYPYQKFIYAGIESGVGSLLGFHLSGPAVKTDEGHIIPFYGHTFNKDTWAPEADKSYFKVGDKLRYVPSENWTSSFLGHDDNFGPNFCVPRLYINPKQVDYVVELLKPGFKFGGSQAEVLSLQFLDSVLSVIDPSSNIWLQRLAFYASRKRIVLRAIAIDKVKYIKHLTTEKDWEGKKEGRTIVKTLGEFLPSNLWIGEVSVPELFPANERKLGDIVLNGGIGLSRDTKDRSNFFLVRLPSLYLFYFPRPRQKKPTFLSYPSSLVSHFPVIRLE